MSKVGFKHQYDRYHFSWIKSILLSFFTSFDSTHAGLRTGLSWNCKFAGVFTGQIFLTGPRFLTKLLKDELMTVKLMALKEAWVRGNPYIVVNLRTSRYVGNALYMLYWIWYTNQQMFRTATIVLKRFITRMHATLLFRSLFAASQGVAPIDFMRYWAFRTLNITLRTIMKK